MVEVVVSRYEEVSKVEDDEKRKEADAETGEISTVKGRKRSDCSRLIVRWEKLIPTMALRILLVEADDSTRQIVAALLKKCGYKVAAVSDGLKAWEILKGRPNNIDLILTEVDLPSISGYALLTLIMEHEICKRIPVIMMSSHDSISTVYKCMLRGAADYLVKPIRRNELRNLWQHVWRRQSALTGVNTLHDESVGQDKVEAISENDTASIHSSRDLALIQNNKECIEKSSDAQSSCTKPDAEGESSHLENMLADIHPTSGKLPSNDTKKQNHVPVSCSTESAAVEPQRQMLDVYNNNHAPVGCSTEAIDFMGASSGHNVSVDSVKSKYEFSPLLDLCLTRCSPRGFETQRTEEKFTLRQSNASAFSRYTGRPLQPTTGDINQKELEAKSVDKFSGTGECKATSLYPHQRVTPMKSSSDGLSLNNLCASFGSIFSPLFGKQSPILSTRSGNQVGPNAEVDPFYRSTWKSNSENVYANESHPSLQKDKRFESLEDRGHISPTTEQSTTSNLCNGGASQLNMAYRSMTGSNSNFDHVTIPLPASETKEEDAILNRSIQREAALNKFRLKRKDRCYEKKVRYESRKKLAEQRPRVKGQFVRQLPAETEQH